MQETPPAPAESTGHHWSGRWTVGLILLLSVALTCGMTFWLYRQMQTVFRQGIDERLMSLAAVAATHFDPADLDRITGPESVETDVYRNTVLTLQRVRQLARHVRFIYILRPTDDPNTLAFVADADSLTPDVPIDLNQDGQIDDADALASPGDPFEVAEYPNFRDAAFMQPFVDPEFTKSQWGTFVSGTVPITRGNATGTANYVLAVDLEVTEYEGLLQRLFIPFGAFVSLLLIVITAQGASLRRLWQMQVRQLREIDRQKDELLSIVSHQLGGPITSLRWSLEGMQEGDLGKLTAEQQEEVSRMQQAASGLADLVSLLLDLSRIELGRLAVVRRAVDLQPFFDELLTVISTQAQEKGVELDTFLPKDLPSQRAPAAVRGARHRLRYPRRRAVTAVHEALPGQQRAGYDPRKWLWAVHRQGGRGTAGRHDSVPQQTRPRHHIRRATPDLTRAPSIEMC
mgnify:CR=1 FL=1